MFGAAPALVGWEFVTWIDLAFEALEEGLAGRAGAGTAVMGSRP